MLVQKGSAAVPLPSEIDVFDLVLYVVETVHGKFRLQSDLFVHFNE